MLDSKECVEFIAFNRTLPVCPNIDGTDFIGVDKALTFQPRQSVHIVSIRIIDDDITEDNEQFAVSLVLSEAGAQAPAAQDTIITIVDNDGMP